jgi:hypothetical protein
MRWNRLDFSKKNPGISDIWHYNKGISRIISKFNDKTKKYLLGFMLNS